MTKKNIQRMLASAILFGFVLIGLQGCVQMVAGAAVATGFAATDRRTVGVQADDKSITLKGELQATELVGDNGHVNVVCFNRKVLVTGEVKDEALATVVENKMAEIDGVLSVVNELKVGPVSSILGRSNDTYITTKVLANLVDAKDLHSNAFKVVTEQGAVYLMGRVTKREGDRAAEIVSSISGVSRVVKVFDYITEEELKALLPEPKPAPKPVEGEEE